MIEKLSVQAYSFREYYEGEKADEKVLDAAFRMLKEIGYDGIQTAGFGNIGIEKYAQAAHSAGLEIIGTHWDFDDLVKNTDEVMKSHSDILKTNIIGIGAMPQYAFEKDGLIKFIQDFNELGDKVSSRGFKLTYHNHHFEFAKIDGKKTIMDYLYEELDPEAITFCLDTHWVQRGGANPTTWVEKLAGRIDILHLKDMAVENTENGTEPYITEIGNGNIDFDSIICAAQKGGVTHYCVEQDICPGNPLDSLKMSADYIRKKYM